MTTPIVVEPHPIGREGVQRSAERAAEAIARGFRSRRVFEWAGQALHDARQRGELRERRGEPDPPGQMRALFVALKRDTTFHKDPVFTELIGGAEAVLCLDPEGACLRGGDCDDMLVALGSAAMSIGIPVRIVTRTYRGQRQAHIQLEYDANARGVTRWTCFDPSTESGTCSSKPATDTFVTEIPLEEHPMFIGVGQPDQGDDDELEGTVGATPAQLSDPEAQGWLELTASVKRYLDETASRLVANANAYAAMRADLGLPAYDPPSVATAGAEQSGGASSAQASPLAKYAQDPNVAGAHYWTADAATQEARVLGTAAFISSCLADALAGSRRMEFRNGDLFIETRAGDPFRVLMAANAQGVYVPSYYAPSADTLEGTVGIWPVLVGVGLVAVVSLAAAYGVGKYCDYLASVHKDDALERITANQTALTQKQADLVAAGKLSGPDYVALQNAQAAQLKAMTDVSNTNAPPEPTIFDKLLTGLKWIAIGAGIIGGIVVVGKGASVVEHLTAKD